ncbi:MAG: 6-bladed beta-propeller [Bacteroidaceae bacterium]|nr:6-bladed beta-propeller [Bacteroidaceae bacterium]
MIIITRIRSIFLLYSLFTGFVFIACNNTAKYESIKNYKTINVLNKDNPISIDIYEIVDSITYIPLDTQDFLLDEVESVSFHDNKYLIKDRLGLSVFNHDGSFIAQISRKGEAPNEYIHMDCFCIDKINNRIGITSRLQNKIMYFSFYGEYLSKSTINGKDTHFANMRILNNGEIMFYHPLSNTNIIRTCEYDLYSPNGNSFISTPIVEGIHNVSDNIYYPFLYNPMFARKDSLFFISALSNDVYKYANNETEIIRIDIPQIKITKDFLRKHKDMNFFDLRELLIKKDMGLGITSITGNENLLFASINNKYTLITDNQEAILLSYVFNPDLNLYSDIALSGGASDDMVGFLSAQYIVEQYDKITNYKLREVAKGIKDEDNPIIYKYHFKKELMSILKEKIE